MKLADLRHFEQFRRLSDEQLILVKPHLRVYECHEKGELILPLGSFTPHEFFLISGKVALHDEHDHIDIIEAGSEQARLSLARLRPTRYEVLAQGPCRLLVVHPDLLASLVEKAAAQSNDFKVQDAEAEQLLVDIRQALSSGQFQVPIMPEVAHKVRQMADREPDLAPEDLAPVIEADPFIVSRLISAANSPLYRGKTRTRSCIEAVTRLGINVTRELVLSFALQQLFHGHKRWVKHDIEAAWRRAIAVGSLSQLLAQSCTELDPERALLTGLVHNIGELMLLSFLETRAPANEVQVQRWLTLLGLPLSVILLQYWRFDEGIVQTVKHCHDWFVRTPGQKPLYQDILIVAQLHAAIGTDRQIDLPRMDQVPAFEKLAPGGLTNRARLKLSDTSRAQLAAVEQLLGIKRDSQTQDT